MSMKLFNTHIHAHTEHKAGSGPLTSLAGSMSLLNINKKYKVREKRKNHEITKKESTFCTLATSDAFRISKGP